MLLVWSLATRPFCLFVVSRCHRNISHRKSRCRADSHLAPRPAHCARLILLLFFSFIFFFVFFVFNLPLFLSSSSIPLLSISPYRSIALRCFTRSSSSASHSFPVFRDVAKHVLVLRLVRSPRNSSTCSLLAFAPFEFRSVRILCYASKSSSRTSSSSPTVRD